MSGEPWGGLRLGEPIPLQGDGWAAMGPQQPRTCSVCGQTVTLKEGGVFDTFQRQTFHHGCYGLRARR